MSPRESEQLALAAIGSVALVGLGWLMWQRQTPPLVVTGAPSGVQTAAWDRALETARWIDVNAAGVAELERLPKVGPALAKRIADDRATHGPFRHPEELQRVPGIGPKTYEALQEYIKAE